MSKKRKIRYKVVKRKTRYSAIINGNSKYALKYEKGAIVEALPGTLGIMLFKNETDAILWCNQLNYELWEDKQYRVVRVIPLCNGKKRHFICHDISTEGLDEYYSDSSGSAGHAPDGTFCHMKVKVLD